MTGITFLFVFLAGAFVGAVVVGVIHAERRGRRMIDVVDRRGRL